MALVFMFFRVFSKHLCYFIAYLQDITTIILQNNDNYQIFRDNTLNELSIY